MAGLGLMNRRRAIASSPTIGNDYILSATKGDAEVFRILMENGVSSDGKGITIEDAASVTSIDLWFRGNSLIRNFDEFQYFTSVTAIGTGNSSAGGAFYGCSALESISFPPSVRSIASYSFYDCISLTTIHCLTSSVPTLGFSVFSNCNQLGAIYVPDLDYNTYTQENNWSYWALAYVRNVSTEQYETCISIRELTEAGFGYRAAAVGSVAPLTKSTAQSWRTGLIDCTPGEMLEFSGMGGGTTFPLYAFIDENNVVLEAFTPNTLGRQVRVVTPDGAVRVVMNANTQTYIAWCCKITLK